MPMPALDFARANVVGPVTSRHQLDVDPYWYVKRLYRNGQCTKFSPFKAGGCFWHVYYYPNGRSTASKDYVSISIALAGGRRSATDDDEPVKARARVGFSLLDHAGEPVPGQSVLSDLLEYDSRAPGNGYGCDFFIKKEFLEASGYLADDCFTIACDVYVEWATTQPYDPQQLLFMDTDVMFRVGGEAFSAHRCVLAARSPVFEAEMFRATRTSAAGAGACCIHVDDMLRQVFKGLLHFAYTNSLPEMAEPEEESMMAEHLLVAADRFGMMEVKLICEEKLSSGIDVNTIAKVLRLAVQHQCLALRDACIEFLQDPPVLEAAMANDADLLELVAKNCPLLLKEMWADEDYPMQDVLAMCF